MFYLCGRATIAERGLEHQAAANVDLDVRAYSITCHHEMRLCELE
jgi:hypothetical protein